MQAGSKGLYDLCQTVFGAAFLTVLFANHSYIATPLHVVSRLEDLTWRGNKVMESEITDNSGWIKYIGWCIVCCETLFVVLSNASPIRGTTVFYIDETMLLMAILAPQYLSVMIGVWLALYKMICGCVSTSHPRNFPAEPFEIRVQR